MLWFYEYFFPVVWIFFFVYWQIKAANTKTTQRLEPAASRILRVFIFLIAIVLLLRGPQTPGELRSRTERMYRFDELTDVQTVLQKLMAREPALVKVLPRQPGTKEARYAHLLSGDIETFEPPQSTSHASASSYSHSSSTVEEDPELKERVAQLEAEVSILTRELSELREQFDRLAKQLE